MDNFAAFRLGGQARNALLRAGIAQTAAPMNERDFRTDQYALVYLHSGEGWWEERGRARIPLGAGSLIQRFPGRRHRICLHGPAVRGWVAGPCQISEMLLALGLISSRQPVLQLPPDETHLQEVRRIIMLLHSASDSELPEVLLQIQQCMMAWLREANASATHGGGASSRGMVEYFMQTLSENLASRTGLPELAKGLPVSYSALRKRFVLQTGMSPGEYRLRRRLERAMELLICTTLQIQQIATELGYADIYTFSAQFKERTGLSPLDFRRRQGWHA